MTPKSPAAPSSSAFRPATGQTRLDFPSRTAIVPPMLRPLRLAAALAFAALPFAAPAADSAAPKSAPSAPRHAIKGVVTGHYAERQSLIIRHEEIPGVMRAMTMAFKVDEATFKAAKQGDHIVGQMSREPDGWRLHDVNLSPPPAAK